MRSGDERERRESRMLIGAPAVLLGLVALAQIHLARTELLSPWKGGGFGMFSSTDVESHRRIYAYGRRGGRVVPLVLPTSLQDVVMRARVLPSEARLHRLALDLAHAQPEGEQPEVVRLEVWRTCWEPASLEPHPVLLRQLEVAVGGHGR